MLRYYKITMKLIYDNVIKLIVTMQRDSLSTAIAESIEYVSSVMNVDKNKIKILKVDVNR